MFFLGRLSSPPRMFLGKREVEGATISAQRAQTHSDEAA
jgi:hypothetical protein